MTILNRKQIDGFSRIGSEATVGDLLATARAYHDLRDAALDLCERAETRDPEWWETFADRRIVPSVIREVVARVERGES